MRKNSKKGFTIVELVIVIAVIAILAGVLIPTFSGVVTKAKNSARLQAATSQYHLALGLADEGTLDFATGDTAVDAYIVVTEEGKNGTEVPYYFSVVNGKLAPVETPSATVLADYANFKTLFTAAADEDLEVLVYNKAN